MLDRRVLFGLLVILNLYLLLSMIWGGGGLFAYLDLDERYAGLEVELSELTQTSLGLSREIRDLTSNPEHQRQVVRERMNYVGADEILYIFPSDAPPAVSEADDDKKD